jgi:hypothetical protein
MTIVGCDFHPGWQEVAVFDVETGEVRKLRLENGNGEAERFYVSLPSPALVGIEASGNSQWFEDLLQLGPKLWNEAGQKRLRELPLEGWAAQRRQDLLQLLGGLNAQIAQLNEAVEGAAVEHPQAQLLMTQPGVGPITALAYVITMGDVRRFPRGKQVGSYLGLIPSEHSSSKRRKLGSISKQGNPFLRMLLVESAQTVCRLDEGFRRKYKHRCHRMKKAVAKVAAARELAVRLFWMLKTNIAYPEIARIEGSPR